MESLSSSHETINPFCFVIEKYTCNIFLNLFILWDMDPADPMSLNHTLRRDFTSNQDPQTKRHKPRTDFIRCSLHCERWTVKKGLRINFAFFQRKNLPDGLGNKPFATIEELNGVCKPGAMHGVQPFVTICSCF